VRGQFSPFQSCEDVKDRIDNYVSLNGSDTLLNMKVSRDPCSS